MIFGAFIKSTNFVTCMEDKEDRMLFSKLEVSTVNNYHTGVHSLISFVCKKIVCHILDMYYPNRRRLTSLIKGCTSI